MATQPMSTEGSGDAAEARPGIAELLERWRVERLADGSVRIRGERPSWWSQHLETLSLAWVGLGLAVLLYLFLRPGDDRVLLAALVAAAFALVLVRQLVDNRCAWLTLSASGLRVDTVWPLGVRSFRRLPWEQITALSLVSPVMDREMQFDIDGRQKLIIPSTRLPTPPAEVWDWVLAQAPLTGRVRELLAAEVRRMRGIEVLDNRTLANVPHPLGRSLLENSPGSVRVRGRGLGAADRAMVLPISALGVLFLFGLLLLDSPERETILVAHGLLGAGVLGLALLVAASSVSREEITATPDGLRVARRSLLGTRLRTLDRRPDSIGLPERWWVWLLWPHLVVTSGDTTLRLGSSLQHLELHWLLARLQALWELTADELDGPAREER